MPESILSTESNQVVTPPDVFCHVCGRVSDQRIALRELPTDIGALLEANADVARDMARVCPHCVELFSRAQAQVDSHQVVFERTDHVLPTPLRMDAEDRKSVV